MPLEIRELTIKVNVNQDPKNAAGSAANNAKSGEEREAVIREAVEEAIRIMEAKNER